MKKTYESPPPATRRTVSAPSPRSRVLNGILKDARYSPEEYLRCLKAGYGGE